MEPRTQPSRPRHARRLAMALSALLAFPGVMAAPGEAASLPARASKGKAAHNWVLAKITTPSVSHIKTEVIMSARGTGGGPLVIGTGYSVLGGPYEFTWVNVLRLSGGSPTVSLSIGPERHRHRVEAVRDDGGTVEASLWPHVDYEARSVAILFFAVNGVVDRVKWVPNMPDVPFRSTVRRGSGAKALMVSEPSSGVTGAAAGAGGGTAEYARRVRTGIVGAMEWLACEACAGTWKAPGQRQRIWATARHHAWPVCWCGASAGLDSWFAGSAGRWSWTWSGVTAATDGVTADDPAYLLAEPVAAAYAPVGRDWRLFRAPEPLISRHVRPVAP